jgi:hypothetical protein
MTSFLEASKELIKGHPYIFGITTMLGLAILVLRKIHYKFVVYPGSLLPIQIYKEDLISPTASDINIRTIEAWIQKT